MNKLLYFLYVCPVLLFSQINESDTLKVKADLSLTGFWQGGNVETVIFRTKSNFTVKPWRKWVYKTTNSYVYQEFGKVKADEDILSLNFVYFNPEAKIYPFVLAFVSTNFRREIDVRTLFGAGATFQIFNKEKDWLKLSISSEYERTYFNETTFNLAKYNGNSEINTLRGTIWINGKYYLFKNKVILGHESYYQPSLEDGDNYRWQGDFSLEMPVWKYINFKINYIHTYESVVIENQNNEDTFLTFGFNIKSY